MNKPVTLRQKIQQLQGRQFTGILDIKQEEGKAWRLYFCLSRLIWADGGYHPYRAWQRLLKKHCPELDQNLINLNEAKQFECWNYYILVVLLQRFLITKEQAILIITEKITDIIFDIYQIGNFHNLSYDFFSINDNFSEESGLKYSITLIQTEAIVNQVEQKWHKWQEAGLTKWFPSHSPMIKNPTLLRENMNDNTYKKLVSLFSGKYSVRELGDKLKLAPFKIITWIKPYLKKGIIELIELKDTPLKITLIGVSNDKYLITKDTAQSLIACVDDSLQICQIMKHIVTQAGYQYVSAQDPLKALPMILKYKPDLIFLDLVMPIINGYEICTQVRRVADFKDVPIIILTSNDGMIDRIRSKIVGANAFLGKPIQEDKVLEKITSLLSNSSPKSNSNSAINKINWQTQTIT